MEPTVQHVATAAPPFWYDQETALRTMRAWIGGDRRTDRLLTRVYGGSGIQRRGSVLGDFVRFTDAEPGTERDTERDPEPDPEADREPDPEPDRAEPLFVNADGELLNPGTGARNARYRETAGALFVRAARAAMHGPHRYGPEDVTHLITVSCTGFYAPGPDLDVLHALGLPPGTERYHLGFMGCYAAFPALRQARAFCRAEPDAVVLIVLAETCTLHLRPSRASDDVIAASVFADGAAGMIVSARPPTGPALGLDRFADAVAPEGADDMAWTIGDHGFTMTLSAYVPRIVGDKADAALGPLLDGTDVDPRRVPRWALHPGGRAIVDRVQDAYDLPDTAVADARAVLAAHGNMSSVTVPYVLERLFRAPGPEGEPVVALAFGPGLTVASALMRWRLPDAPTGAEAS